MLDKALLVAGVWCVLIVIAIAGWISTAPSRDSAYRVDDDGIDDGLQRGPDDLIV